MRNLYDILELPRTADEAAIKKAYRQLAKEYHPDHNNDNPSMAERFKEVSAAYAILGDTSQRNRYDRGEIDELGNQKAHSYHNTAGSRDSGGGNQKQYTSKKTSFDFEEAESVFSDFFRFTKSGDRSANAGARYGKAGGRFSRDDSGPRVVSRGLDISYEITVGFEEALNGSKRQITLNSGKKVNVSIPEGIQSGQVVRLPGQGGDGLGGGEPGDALIEVIVAPHPYYKRDGLNILLDLPISLEEAILGGDIQVPTPKGRITVRVPKGSSSGRRLRLKGKGVARRGETGHLYVSLKLVLPDTISPDLEKAIKAHGGGDGPKLRKEAGIG